MNHLRQAGMFCEGQMAKFNHQISLNLEPSTELQADREDRSLCLCEDILLADAPASQPLKQAVVSEVVPCMKQESTCDAPALQIQKQQRHHLPGREHTTSLGLENQTSGRIRSRSVNCPTNHPSIHPPIIDLNRQTMLLPFLLKTFWFVTA